MPISAAPKIILIRHAEKPDDSQSGVSLSGKENAKDLSVRGWQRAGALVCYLAPPAGRFQHTALETPRFLFASHSSSNRPYQTLAPIADKLGIKINVEYGKGDEANLAAAAKACAGVALICWQHEYMSSVANAILGNNRTAPQDWPSTRFDVTWIFDLDPSTGSYRFEQLPQRILAGDLPAVL